MAVMAGEMLSGPEPDGAGSSWEKKIYKHALYILYYIISYYRYIVLGDASVSMGCVVRGRTRRVKGRALSSFQSGESSFLLLGRVSPFLLLVFVRLLLLSASMGCVVRGRTRRVRGARCRVTKW